MLTRFFADGANAADVGEATLPAQDLVAKARHYLRLSTQCSDTRMAKALRIFAEYLIDKARDEEAEKKRRGNDQRQ